MLVDGMWKLEPVTELDIKQLNKGGTPVLDQNP